MKKAQRKELVKLKYLFCVALRHVAFALLKGVSEREVKISSDGKYEGWASVVSAKYMRDRIGVPRDLPYPAARQLRAHMNWFIDSLDK